MIISCASAISTRLPETAIAPIPATCPAEVTQVIEMSIAAIGGMPIFTAVIPNANDTDRYPRPIGRPSFKPFRYSDRAGGSVLLLEIVSVSDIMLPFPLFYAEYICNFIIVAQTGG